MRLFSAEFWGSVYVLSFPCAVQYADQRPIFNRQRYSWWSACKLRVSACKRIKQLAAETNSSRYASIGTLWIHLKWHVYKRKTNTLVILVDRQCSCCLLLIIVASVLNHVYVIAILGNKFRSCFERRDDALKSQNSKYRGDPSALSLLYPGGGVSEATGKAPIPSSATGRTNYHPAAEISNVR